MKLRHGNFSFADFFLLLAVVLFFLATVGYIWKSEPWPWNTRLIAAGLFCWSISEML